MKSSEKEISRAFNVFLPVPPSLSRRIMALNERLKAFWDKDFVLELVHLTLYYTVIPKRNIPKLENILSGYVKDMKPVTVTLGNIVFTDNYIFIEIENNNKLLKINRDLISLISPLREGVIMQKYLQVWDSFSEEKRDLIIQTGHQYPYSPHLTIAKLKEGTLDKAWDMLKGAKFKGASFIAKTVRLGVIDEGAAVRSGKERFSYKIGK